MEQDQCSANPYCWLVKKNRLHEYLFQIFNIKVVFILVKVKEAAVEIPTPNTSGGVYIPPTRRLQSAGGSSSSSSAASKSRTGWKKSCVKKDILFKH